MITIMDTPGGNDESLPNFNVFRQLQTALKSLRYVDLILICVSPQDIMRRMESFNTYLQEFNLMIGQETIVKAIRVVITRAHVLIPHFYKTEAKLREALEEAVLRPLRYAFGAGNIPVFKVSLAIEDYIEVPGAKNMTIQNLQTMYNTVNIQDRINTQKLAPLATRVRRLIKEHLRLEDDNSKLTEKQAETSKEFETTKLKYGEVNQKYSKERESHTKAKNDLTFTKNTLHFTETQLLIINEKMSMMSEQLEKLQ
eukprot:UN31092